MTLLLVTRNLIQLELLAAHPAIARRGGFG